MLSRLKSRASRIKVKRLFRSRVAFCAGSALLMVALRLLIFDYPVFFRLQFVPNHDIYQGAPFFVTSMHSVSLSGEIAWWNAASINGYAQYYQSFFSPLAPTSHHLVFILWAQAIRILSLMKTRVPEYFQFLTITYVLFPFLAFFSFALFASQIFRRRATVFLVLTVYTFSGIGLWNSAWFFFQEPFTLFLLLAASMSALKRPTARRLVLLLAAALIQLTSINYWTVYNSWFVLVLALAYCWAYTNRVRRLLVRTRQIVRSHKRASAVVCITFLLVFAVWFVIIGSIVREQSGNYISSFTGASGVYSVEDALSRVQEMRRFTTELFNPEVRRAIAAYKIENEMHNARYIGAFLLPLLVLMPALFWRRRERWLIASAAGVLFICLAPPFLLSAWKAVPFMDRIRHLFYFYTQYWQLLLVLIAGASMEIVLERAYTEPVRRRFLFLTTGLACLLALLFIGYLSFSHLFPANDYTLQANIRFALLALVSSLVLLQTLLFPAKKNRQLFVLLICLLALTDLTRYFREVSLADKSFTETRWPVASPLPQDVRAHLESAWPAPALSNGFKSDLYGNMPVSNVFWYDNGFMSHRYVLELRKQPEEFQERELHGPPLAFYRNADEGDGSLSLAAEETQGFTYQWREWSYNDFSFEVNAPFDGWLLIRQIDDPLWRVTVDDKPASVVRANLTGMAMRIKGGTHHIRMSYRPLARTLYWPAAWMLEGALLLSVFLAVRCKKKMR
jgi:hypothetical protein